ncbi:MAG: Stk1 family PASTA domain-containing Ser/Thr kinase [Peptostreptococcaceae bacterium]
MGDTILGNRYQIIRKIGDGGMAFVYEAKDKLLNRTVAVKVLRPEFVDDEEFLKKFTREAEAVANISHPNIVNVYDVGEDGKVHYIVMEYIDGENLKDIIKNEGTLDEYTALDITKQIAMALSAAHKKGVIHRDIKPHNILISNEERAVKVADFGIAKAASNSTMTNVGSIIGSVHYFSPEQAKGKSVNPTADLYSLGIVLYEMIIGRVPFRGDSPISIALQHINEEVDFTSEEKINIPQSVRTIIKKLTEKSSQDRYQSAEELIEDIEYVEKNIDLDFIKEYDNFATKQIDMDKIERTASQNYDIEEDELLEEEPKIVAKPKKEKKVKKKNKSIKEDSPKTKKRLKIVLGVLVVILVAQVFFISKFVSGLMGGGSKQEQTVSVPDLENQDLESVNKKLEALGLKISVKTDYSDTVEKDKVISQSPSAGTEASLGDTVTIVLSRGPKKEEDVSAPNVVGLSLTAAEKLLNESNFVIGNVKYEYSSIHADGIVMEQSIGSGQGSVSVVVSKGPKKVEEDNSNNENTEKPPTTNNGGTTTKPGTGGSSGGSTGSGSGSGSGGHTGGTGSDGNTGGESGSGGTGSDGNTGGESGSGGSSDGGDVDTGNPTNPDEGNQGVPDEDGGTLLPQTEE